jgi:hypothetical protein
MLTLIIAVHRMDHADVQCVELWLHEEHLRYRSSQWCWGRVWGADLARIVGLTYGSGGEVRAGCPPSSPSLKHQHQIANVEQTEQAIMDYFT